jgi:hypothetical protein
MLALLNKVKTIPDTDVTTSSASVSTHYRHFILWEYLHLNAEVWDEALLLRALDRNE